MFTVSFIHFISASLLNTRNYQELEDVNQILYVIMVLLPVLWLVGLLPPLDALFSWLGEQVLVLAFGGTYMASDFR